jgi:hypothetical protein
MSSSAAKYLMMFDPLRYWGQLGELFTTNGVLTVRWVTVLLRNSRRLVLCPFRLRLSLHSSNTRPYKPDSHYHWTKELRHSIRIGLALAVTVDDGEISGASHYIRFKSAISTHPGESFRTSKS